MSILFWIIETVNWVLYGGMGIVFKVIERETYDWNDPGEWASCYHILRATRGSIELWLSAIGVKLWFPEFLRDKYLLGYKEVQR